MSSLIYEMEGADEEELWFDEYGTADHGAAVGGAGADVVSGYYECRCDGMKIMFDNF